MGSPYNIADIEISGGFVPNLRGLEFQDFYCINDIGDSVILVQWSIKNNQPGFIIWMISENKSIQKSSRFEGICESISFSGYARAKIILSKNNKKEELDISFGDG
jgi:hypothetical protein